MADMDPDMLFEWIYENAPSHVQDPEDLARVMEALAKADLYRSRVRSSQRWELIRYAIDLMTAGVAMARRGRRPSKWIPMRFPERIRMMSKTKEERELQLSIGRRVARKCHISSVRAVREVLPYLRFIFENNREMAVGIARWLNLDPDMVHYLAGGGEQAKAILKELS